MSFKYELEDVFQLKDPDRLVIVGTFVDGTMSVDDWLRLKTTDGQEVLAQIRGYEQFHKPVTRRTISPSDLPIPQLAIMLELYPSGLNVKARDIVRPAILTHAVDVNINRSGSESQKPWWAFWRR